MYKVTSGDSLIDVEFNQHDTNTGTLNGTDFSIDSATIKDGKFHVLKNNKSYNVEIIEANYADKTFHVKVNGTAYEMNVQDKFDQLLESMGMSNMNVQKVTDLKAPMPGLVLDIKVAAGTQITKGDALLVLEAMKMENIIKSPTDGVVKSITTETGKAVEKNEVLIEFE